MCLCLRRFAQRVLAFACCVIVLYVLQVFIPIYRGFERRLRISRYINLSCLELWFFTIDLLPDLIIVLWRTNFKSIPFETEQRQHQYYCYSCLDVEISCKEGGWRGMRRVSGCTLRTLYFVNSGVVASDEMLLISLLLMTLLLMTCLQERFLQTRFIQTQFFQTHFFQTQFFQTL